MCPFPDLIIRWASSYARPPADSDNQASNVNGGLEGPWTFISFSIPCESQDPDDIPIVGRHYLMFATGQISRGQLLFHGFDKRWVTSNQIEIFCGGKQREREGGRGNDKFCMLV